MGNPDFLGGSQNKVLSCWGSYILYNYWPLPRFTSAFVILFCSMNSACYRFIFCFLFFSFVLFFLFSLVFFFFFLTELKIACMCLLQILHPKIVDILELCFDGHRILINYTSLPIKLVLQKNTKSNWIAFGPFRVQDQVECLFSPKFAGNLYYFGFILMVIKPTPITPIVWGWFLRLKDRNCYSLRPKLGISHKG